MAGARSYQDPCGIARALDLVGERWALLVVRELMLGPKRFTDLRHGLHGVSPNVLSQRLRELEDGGIVERQQLGPPASTLVYQLTERGLALEPVLLALGRWGSRTAMTSAAELGTDALMLALKSMFDPGAADGLTARFELRLGHDRFRAEVAGARLTLARGSSEEPDAVIDTDAATLRSVVFGGRPIDDALRSGELGVLGDGEAAARFVTLFGKHRPADTGADTPTAPS